ncbi:PREDICTED: lysozyme c-1-like [Nicrophorus vespilloides]|uniref:lysozyme n=1 Tax=Nicrophorus vespilloides TaxID=110193 RepID=A0ABM1MBK2_NICVS|nr:PREDICTED: lysozyme c-1-like [Nicrophorus vespilloides]
MKFAICAIVLCGLVTPNFAKVFSPTEFGNVMLANGIPKGQIETWKCIAKWESSYNTAAHNTASGDHGIFQINERWWCSPPGKGCGMTCNSLRDADITNDIKCAKIIYEEHQRLTGNGFNAWVAYKNHCR